MPLVDVIMPHFGQGLWLWKAQAIASMREEHCRIVHVDAFESLPNEVSVYVDSLEAKRVVLPYPTPSYEALYEQINIGFLEGSNKYVLVFGSDDIMYHGMIDNMVRLAEEKQAKVVYCNYEMMDESGKHIDYIRLNPRYEFGLNCKTSHYPDVSLFRRDVVEEFEGWDVTKGRYAMWWLWLQIGRKYPTDIHHLDYFGFRYRQHAGGMHNRESQDDRAAFVESVREWLGHVPENH